MNQVERAGTNNYKADPEFCFIYYFVFTFRRLQLQTVVTEATLAGSLKTGFLIECGNTRILKLFHLDSSL